jgi:signal transduction histidine kinase
VGAAFDKVYFCPHSKAEECECRKPKPYFLKRAERELNLDLSKSFMIGDMTSDIQLAKAGGCRSILVETGRGGKDGMFQATADYVAKDLAAAAQWIEAEGPVVRGASSNPPTLAGGVQEGMDKLVTSVSADFNNIFGSILGCVALIGQRSGGEGSVPGVDETLTILKRAADRGLAISKKMGGLLWSGETSKSKRSLTACIGSVVELLRSSHGDECQIELLCPQDVEVEMADFVVVQMLLELCENSLQAMATLPERFILFHVDRVEVKNSRSGLDIVPGSYAKVSIVDHGEGISLERREVVFEPAETERSQGSAGMGVSLSMAKSVMRKHGGTITLASQLNAGTNISLYFPLAQK